MHDPLVGRCVRHYRILDRIGGGGMGVVYRAEDTRLGRTVALKFLHEDLTGDAVARERFLREARAASSIDHPNICSIYEIEQTDDGRLFISMAWCEGETLRARMARGGTSLAEAVEIAAQVGDGLGRAHSRGIAHRDVKPENVMLTGGVVKIIDFGLARLLAESRITRDHSTLGTVAYMSPEQTRGDEAGPRSDVWSLGVVLYELLTGERPFGGGSPDATIYAIRNDVPVPPSALASQVHPALERIVLTALEKLPERRHGDGTEFAARLRGVPVPDARPGAADATTVTLTGRRAPRTARRVAAWAAVLALAACAVLAAFVGLRGRARAPAPAPDDELRVAALLPQNATGAPDHWPDLIQALLAGEITGVRDLGVLDPLSLNGLLAETVGTTAHPSKLYDVLLREGVRLALAGSILGDESGYRLVENLVDVRSGEVLFTHSARFRDEDDVPAIVRACADALLAFIQVHVQALSQDSDLRPWVSSRNRNLEAIKEFLQASQYEYRYAKGAGAHLQRAIELDPGFIAPRIWLVSALVSTGDLASAREHYRVLRSLEHGASPFELAMIRWADAYIRGEVAEQARHLEVALDFSPGNNILLVNLAWVRYQMGDCDAALGALRPAAAARWRFPPLYDIQGRCLILLGRPAEARRCLEDARAAVDAVEPTHAAMLEALAVADGDSVAAARFHELYLTRLDEQKPAPPPSDLGPIYARLGGLADGSGAHDRAAWLFEHAVEQEPRSASHRLALAEALLRTGDRDRARAQAAEALKLDPALGRAGELLRELGG